MEAIISIFLHVSVALSLPPDLLKSICYVESKHKTGAIHYNDGTGHSMGICQIKYQTAKTLGYKGPQYRLMEPKTNIYWAGKYLAKQLKRYDGDIAKAVAAYNAGTYRENPNGATLNRKYVAKVFNVWVAYNETN